MISMEELFPGFKFENNQILWNGGVDYVGGYRGIDDKYQWTLRMDGDFTSAQLRALADWLDRAVD